MPGLAPTTTYAQTQDRTTTAAKYARNPAPEWDKPKPPQRKKNSLVFMSRSSSGPSPSYKGQINRLSVDGGAGRGSQTRRDPIGLRRLDPSLLRKQFESN